MLRSPRSSFDNFTHLRIGRLDRAGKSLFDLSVSVGPQSVSAGSQSSIPRCHAAVRLSITLITSCSITLQVADAYTMDARSRTGTTPIELSQKKGKSFVYRIGPFIYRLAPYKFRKFLSRCALVCSPPPPPPPRPPSGCARCAPQCIPRQL
jgi:hypothetical protein